MQYPSQHKSYLILSYSHYFCYKHTIINILSIDKGGTTRHLLPTGGSHYCDEDLEFSLLLTLYIDNIDVVIGVPIFNWFLIKCLADLHSAGYVDCVGNVRILSSFATLGSFPVHSEI